MTDRRKRIISDSYSPVVDIPSAGDYHHEPHAPAAPRKDEVPVIDSSNTKKNRNNRGRKVRSAERGRAEARSQERAAKPKTRDKVSLDKSIDFTAIRNFFKSQTFRWLAGIFLGGFAVYLLVAFVSYFTSCIADQAAIINSPVGSLPPVANRAGEGGARLSEFFINGSFGLGSFVLILWIGMIALRLLSGWPHFKTVNFTIKCLVALITVSLIIGLLTIAWDTPVNWGGYHGRYVNEFVVGFFGWTGAVILCLVLVATFFVICLRDVVNWVIRKKNEIAARRREAARLRHEQEELERELNEMRIREEMDAVRAGESKGETEEFAVDDRTVSFSSKDVEIDPSIAGYDIEDEPLYEPVTHSNHRAPAADYTVANGASETPYTTAEMPYSTAESPLDGGETPYVAGEMPQPAGEMPYGDGYGDATADYRESGADSVEVKENIVSAPGDPMVEGVVPVSEEVTPDLIASENGGNPAVASPTDSDALSVGEDASQPSAPSNPGLGRMVVNVNQIAKADAPVENHGSLKEMYKLPPSTLLKPGTHKVTADIEEQNANKERIRETLLYHKIPITSIEATIGPTVTLYEIRPEQGVKIAKIKNLADDIALSLAAKGVRVIAPIPGKGTVGIEVANAEPQTVSMRTIIESRKYAETRYRLPVALGATIGNDVYIADLTKMPHLLVAGATGQGKSVGLNAIISSLLYKKRPDELKFVMIDPKEVEFSLYARIENHYLAKLEDSDAIVTDMSKVVATLQSLCVEMDNRYKLLRTANVRNIEEYNTKYEQGVLDQSEGHRFLPYIVLVVDEFADLIMTSGKEVETPIARLAQKARAIGIHVIIATQRPSTNVITGIIKANFPVRIAFRVSSGIDSKTILDTTGAQQLIGKGDMLISNNSEMVRVQCAFIDTPEVEEVCNYIHDQPFNSGAYLLPDPMMVEGGESAGASMGGADTLDPLFEEVAEMVVSSGVGSTSGIQRRFSIGYNRAGKIMDQLEHYGVVGPSMGGKPRQVLMDMYSLQELMRNLK
ncbi:MAG: DNA translocase FtsK [Muribaculaceae bacterium]|nr:DNA translocase FtsK [Muribaculaceae bacterium]